MHAQHLLGVDNSYTALDTARTSKIHTNDAAVGSMWAVLCGLCELWLYPVGGMDVNSTAQ